MIDIQDIAKKIAEEKGNIVAKAFTVHIGELLKENGIVPVMTEYTKQDIDEITDASEYKLVTEFGVGFNELDTSKHDAKVRADAINAIKNVVHARLLEEMNDPYQDQSLCQGLHYAIHICDWYLNDDKEQKNE